MTMNLVPFFGWCSTLVLLLPSCAALGLKQQHQQHQQQQQPILEVSRRSLLAGTAAAASSLLWIDPALADSYSAFVPGVSGGMVKQPFVEKTELWTPPQLSTKLGASRISATSLSPLQQAPFSSQELYYAPFLFGAWDVTATLKQKAYPFGKDFVPSKSLLEGSPRNRNEQVGDATSFQLHYFSTLADTLSNQMTVNLGLGVPKPQIIADRAFNTISMSRAYQQLTPVEEVDWDYSADPTRLTLRFGAAPLADDMRPLGQRRGEVYLTARASELLVPSEDTAAATAAAGSDYYCAAERSRSVTLGPGIVITADQESITEFQRIDEDSVRAISRIAVYLTPNPNSREGVLWQQVGGKAVAFYDYEWNMKRIKEEFVLRDGSKVLRPCVATPKDVVQC
jgi:hypothetical protein